MKHQIETSVPAYLQELLQPTPSGSAKLIAAWDGLTPETQMQMLAAKKKSPGPGYLYQQVLEKALACPNSFVRYMAAREINLNTRDEREKKIKELIDSDSEPLVKYAHLETSCSLGSDFDDPEKFFALPHEARLAKMRRLTGGGEEVANLVSYAAEHLLKDGKLSEIEIFEILSDYLVKPDLKDRYIKDRLNYDGFGEYLAGKDIEALWGLVLKVPENISHVLIEHLPESAGLSSGIPRHILSGMSDRQLATLLYRSDVGLEELRKQKFFEASESDDEKKDYAKHHMQCAAITHAFDLTNEEFAEILSKPGEQRVRILKDLSMMAQGLRLCLYEAIHDALFVSEVSPMGSDYEHAEWAKRTFERKLEELKGWQRERELRELRLYRLAVQAVPWKRGEKGYPPTDELAFLAEAIVEGGTWATFAAFCKKWDEARYRTNRLERSLPKIWEAGEEDDLTLDEDDVDEADRLANRVATKLSDILVAAGTEPYGDESKLAQVLDKLSGHATVAQEETLETAHSVRDELAGLREDHKLQLLLYLIVIGILVVLLFLRW